VGNQLLDLFLLVDDGQHDRCVLGKRPMAGMVNSGARPVSLNSSIHGRAGHSQFHAFGYDRFMQWLALPLVALAEVNA
jgi:hypothetical protein